MIFLNYMNSIKALDPNLSFKTQGIFSTSPGNGNNALDVHLPQAFMDQVLGTAVLVFLIFAITDVLGANPTPAVSAIAVGLIIVGIGFALGTNDGYAINPARDFAPRLMEWIVGYKDAWLDQRGNVFFWVPILGPLVGGLVGGGVLPGHDRAHPADHGAIEVAPHRHEGGCLTARRVSRSLLLRRAPALFRFQRG